MTISATTRQKLIGALMLVAALLYLLHFVPRGWIAHDEGMLGQTAERVLRGDVPHIDYEEPYTGGLSWIYAGVFKVSGIDLLHIRWLLFAGAAFAMWLTYAVLRRYLRPVAAAVGMWVALAWSFANYFAGLPSWWLLICALCCVWAVVRHVETRDWKYVALAGLAAGLAIAIKQTGIYLFVALVLFLLYEGRQPVRTPSASVKVEGIVRWAAAIGAIALGVIVLAPRMLAAEGLYLFCPAAACAIVMLLPSRERLGPSPRVYSLTSVVVASIAAMIPIALVLLPYLIHGHIQNFVYGAFWLPRKRLAYASLRMPPVALIVTGIPMIGLVMPLPRSVFGSRSRFLEVVMWMVAAALAICALWNALAYQYVWQSTRAFATLLPLAICWRLAKGQVAEEQRAILFMTGAALAWAALNQFPYAGAIYFSYVAPLAVIAGVALGTASSSLRVRSILPWALMLLLFALLGPHRAYVETLGAFNVPRRFDTPLDLPRAHLNLNAREADMYRRVVSSIESHIRDGQLIAAPDCPELYFLTGAKNPSGRLFEFFSESAGGSDEQAAQWSSAEVIVVNHRPAFSPTPIPALLAQLRKEFPNGEEIGKFEVRWR